VHSASHRPNPGTRSRPGQARKTPRFTEATGSAASSTAGANSTDATLVKLANGTRFSFRQEDTIRLELTRKYRPDAVTELLDEHHCPCVSAGARTFLATMAQGRLA
jgi:hypothetical protein